MPTKSQKRNKNLQTKKQQLTNNKFNEKRITETQYNDKTMYILK